ncbi:lipopolysaccharide biosynthesis protein [Parasutterella secunda]|uniref:lipopolysaccharide biosynthesis protein n=1 Tax=Parasutterella secunda TaxID=626947 RepID=UPI0025A380AB|nr:hypothetical protein [Parasutterella secunda]MDM8217884.1 hypothetical protein [Parasutterella secunda]
MTITRTTRVVQNAKVAVFFYCLNILLQFFSRKIFLDFLGAELLGLNTTIQNLLQFLNLAESGIGAAVAFALYKPLSQGNRQQIIDIVTLQGWFYYRIGLIVIAGSVVLMLFFPWIFAKADISLVYAYGTFIVFLVGSLLSYFVNYKVVLLSADQKDYSITFETQSIKIAKIIFQMVAVCNLSNGYLWWMCLEGVATLFQSIRLHLLVKKSYPWLNTSYKRTGDLKSEYGFILKKTKQLFFQKVSVFLIGQATPLVVYAFTSLTTVAIYGNYLIIMKGCQMMTDALSRGLYAGVGNLVVERDLKYVKEVFWKVFTFRLYIAAIICSGIILTSAPFVKVWLGEEYVMSSWPVGIMACIYFIRMSRTSDIFLAAYGLFHDIWAPITESVLNLGLSLLFGYLWGLTGIFSGVLISQVLIVNSWKAYFLYKEGFREQINEFIVLYTKKIVLILFSLFVTYYFSGYLSFQIITYKDWLLYALIVVIFYSALLSFLLLLFDQMFKELFKQMLSLMKY